MSHIKLFLTIYLSIVLAGVTLYFLGEYRTIQIAEAVMQEMEAQAEKAKFEMERAAFLANLKGHNNKSTTNRQAPSNGNVLQASRAYRSSYDKERRQRRAAHDTNHEVCGFWRKEYNKRKSKYNKSMMDGACYRANHSHIY